MTEGGRQHIPLILNSDRWSRVSPMNRGACRRTQALAHPWFDGAHHERLVESGLSRNHKGDCGRRGRFPTCPARGKPIRPTKPAGCFTRPGLRIRKMVYLRPGGLETRPYGGGTGLSLGAEWHRRYSVIPAFAGIHEGL